MPEPIPGPYVVLVVPEQHVTLDRSERLTQVIPSAYAGISCAALAQFETASRHGQLCVTNWAFRPEDRTMVVQRLRDLADFIERSGG